MPEERKNTDELCAPREQPLNAIARRWRAARFEAEQFELRFASPSEPGTLPDSTSPSSLCPTQ